MPVIDTFGFDITPLFLLGLCVLLLRRLLRRRRKHGKNRAKTPRLVHTQSATTPPFNSATARPVPRMVSISGPAYVVDGDTVVIRKTQIRLFGIDAPEIDHPYGNKAKWALVNLCKGQTVRAEVSATDHHGRTVARCFLPDGRDLSKEMVTAGLAIDWPKYSGGVYRPFEVPDARKKMWLADARQKGRMDVWARYEARR